MNDGPKNQATTVSINELVKISIPTSEGLHSLVAVIVEIRDQSITCEVIQHGEYKGISCHFCKNTFHHINGAAFGRIEEFDLSA